MKSVQEWKRLLGTVHFPNFNKLGNDELIGFIFTDCKQRDALLTWIVILLGADCKTNGILKHEDIVEYLNRRRVIEKNKVGDFVNAKLSEEEQEAQWDKIFSFIKMQKRLIPQPYEKLPGEIFVAPEEPVLNKTFQDFPNENYSEPLYKELEMFKILRKLKLKDIETAPSSGDYQPEQTSEDKGVDNVEMSSDKNNQEENKKTDVKKSKSVAGEGDVSSEKQMLPIEESKTGKWYCSSDGLQKVFIPKGAPPLGELDFDLRKMKIVREDDEKKHTQGTEKDIKLAERIEGLINSLAKCHSKTSNEE